MPYEKNEDLPPSVKDHLPPHAQDIFRETFNHAYEEYKDPSKRRHKNEDLEQVCFKVAWSSVHNKYEKGKDNNWHKIE